MAICSHRSRIARRAIWPAAAILIVTVAAIGLAAARNPARMTAPHPFSWLRPARPPAGWNTAATPSGATLAYPPDWHQIQSDHGSVSAAPAGPRESFAGYLNATPRSGEETLANWRRFRVAHVAEEGARDVRLSASATKLRFRSGHGSCVVDSYSTTKARFREIACIVAGARATTVIVAAAPIGAWTSQSPVLERGISSFTT